MKPTPIELAHFALDVISDAVLIIERTDDNTFAIVHANEALERLCGINGEEMKLGQAMFLIDEDRFLQIAKEATDNNSVIAPRLAFQLKKNCSQSIFIRLSNHNSKQYVNAFVTFHPYTLDEHKYCCCIFKRFHIDEQELFEYYTIIDRYTPCNIGVVEYDAEKDDICWMYSNRNSSLQKFEMERQSLNGLYLVQDLGVHDEVTVSGFSTYREFETKCTPETEQQLIDTLVVHRQSALTLNSVERVIDHITYFVGRNPRTGRCQYLSIGSDVTDTINAARKLQQKEQNLKEVVNRCKLFETIFEACPINMGILHIQDLTDWHGNTMVCCNPESAKMYGIDPPRSLYNIKVTDLYDQLPIPDEIIDQWLRSFQEASVSGRLIEFEHQLIDPITKELAYYYNYVKYVDDDNYIFLSQNITPRKLLDIKLQQHKDQLESEVKERTKQLEDALEVKSRFLATMSHEIRTPLSGIIGMLSLLSESLTETAHQEMIRIASVCGDQLMIVINDILDLSRLENNMLPIESNNLSLRKTVEESLEVVAFESEKKGLDLICNIDYLLPDTIVGDATRLRQVLINLLGNAVKFSTSGDIIVAVSGKKIKDAYWQIQFAVQDHGIGISDEAKHKLFSPFQQADNSYTRKFGGSGLGLVISKKMVELMGGKMWFESTEGRGSTFFFDLPVACVSSHMPSQPEALRGKRALVVETNEAILQSITQFLQTIGMIVIAFLDSAKAMNSIPNNTFDVVVLGKQHTQLISEVNGTYCIVLCSSYLEHSPQAGVYYLPLPLRFTKLYDTLVLMFTNSSNLNTCYMATPDLQDVRVLVAEDNTLNQKVVKKVLDSMHCKSVEIVADGKQALEALKNNKFDVVLMDCMMPVMNGFEATSRIRSDIPAPDQPAIIALTANAFEENKRHCLLSGMDEVLTKPLKKNDLVNILSRVARKELTPSCKIALQ